MAERHVPLSPARTPLRLAVLLLAIVVGTLQTGCVHYPEPRHTYEFLTRYDRMSPRLEPRLSLIYLPPGASFSSYRNLIVGNVAVGENWVESPVQAQRYATYLRMLLARELRDTERFQVVELDPGGHFTGPTVRFEGKLTGFDTGSGAMRFFSYFLFFLQSGGATDLQIEGRLYDAATGEVLMELVDRRRHLGNTPWLPNPKTFSDEFVMKHTVWETARSLAGIISRLNNGLPPREQKTIEDEESQ